MALSKQYTPQEHERAIYQQWEKAKAFVAQAESSKAPFVISMPPPNATGELHMGHASFLTIQDIIVRYMRMRGRETLWLPGTDHAAIATENVVLRKIKKEEHIRDPRTELGREEVLRRIAAYVEQSRATIQTQIRSLGASCDWSRERYTMDAALSRSVNEVFKRMYDDGLIYRGARIVNWDRQLKTTVSDDEIEWQEEKTPLYTFQYGPFAITTARPETKFGDKYVVMHPDDERYATFKHGDTFTAEWINGPVTATVIKDAAVDPSFGTGVMTITPWHDAVDFEIAERHQLDKEQIIDFEGKLLPIAGDFAGQTIAEARPAIVAKLQQKGLLITTDNSYVHNVAVSSRGGGVIEPQIKLQWFIDVNKQVVTWQGKQLSLKEVLQQVVKSGDITLFPERFTTVYFQWIDNLRDWCISRQIWWGHRVPVWYRGEETYVGVGAPEGEGWEQDTDTLDTWFSSAMWTWSTLLDPVLAQDQTLTLEELFKRSPDYQKFHPTQLMETGFDILFFWVARMILVTTYATGQIPFKHVYLNGLVRTKSGKKMSKSDPSTMINPNDLIERHGADATRFGLAYNIQYDSQTIPFDEQAVVLGRNFANKVWNLARLLESLPERDTVTLADQWIEGRLHAVNEELQTLIEQYKVGEAARLVHDFVWDDFADWYMEILKVEGSTVVARRVYTAILQLLHPFLPFITEYLWQHLGQEGLLVRSSWPTIQAAADTEKEMNRFKEVVTAIRSARALLELPFKEQLTITLGDDIILPTVIETLTNTQIVSTGTITGETIQWPLRESNSPLTLGVTEEVRQQNVPKARARLEKQFQEAEAYIAREQAVLQQMQAKAPAESIAAKAESIRQAEAEQQKIQDSLQRLA